MIQLELLGPVALTREDGTSVESVLAQPKRLALLAYLAAAAPGSAHPRDTLLGLLWPELDQDRARRALRQALHGLRRSLGPGVLTGKGEDRVGVDPERLRCDVVGFRRAVAAGRDRDALAIYRGAFLEGIHVPGAPGFERWVDRLRRELGLEAVQVALRAAGAAEREGDRAAARKWAERAIALAPYDGAVIRRYLELMSRLGQPAAAVRAYHAYEARLRDDLGLEPSAETKELAARLRAVGSASTADGPANDGGEGFGPESSHSAGVEPGAATGALTGAGHGAVEEGAARGGPVSRSHRRVIAAGVAVVLLVALAWVAELLPVSGATPGGGGPIRSIAVLPFEDMSPGGDQRWFGEGIAEEILNRLGSVEGLRVTARSSSFQFRGASADVRMVGDSLRVGSVLEGSVRRAGDRVRITVQLVRTSDGAHLWSRSYERELSTGAFFEVQEEIARSVADALLADLDLTEADRLATRPPMDLEAYSLYLRARHAVRERRPESRRRALVLVQRALEEDPEFAPAWALLAMIRTLGPFWRGFRDTTDYGTSQALALEAAERAVRLDPGLAEGHTMMGLVLSNHHEWDRAERHLERAVALNPSDPMARGARLWHLASHARWEEAL
ncbi:MAG: BTAD domain-containing putative transcriptional regulator, partial [Longimicrobiales bacterium]|nr:BTAD domain-containing putative transcriptional regulator [Longimicrobiales bacterium]